MLRFRMCFSRLKVDSEAKCNTLGRSGSPRKDLIFLPSPPPSAAFRDAKAAPRKGNSTRLKALGCCTSRQNSGRHFQPSWYDRPDGKRVKVGSFFASSRPDARDYLRCVADALQRRVLSRKRVIFWRVTVKINRARRICMPCPKASSNGYFRLSRRSQDSSPPAISCWPRRAAAFQSSRALLLPRPYFLRAPAASADRVRCLLSRKDGS